MKTLILIMLFWVVPIFAYSADSTKYVCRNDTQHVAKNIARSTISSQALYSPYRRYEKFPYWNWCLKRKSIIEHHVYVRRPRYSRV